VSLYIYYIKLTMHRTFENRYPLEPASRDCELKRERESESVSESESESESARAREFISIVYS
jgi:hypothetical protein